MSTPDQIGRGDAVEAEVAAAPTDRSWLRSAQRLVIKIGSRALVDEHNQLDERQVRSLIAQMAGLAHTGREIICVSSGAVAAGLPDLGLSRRPSDLPSLQAAAAIGQARLMSVYREGFAAHGAIAAQVLLTHPDLRSRVRHLNARHTLSRLLQAKAIPVINENDTVSVDEIRFGDNDRLSALVATLVHADALVLLTNTDGLLNAPPEQGGTLVPHVPQMTKAVRELGGDAGSTVSTGGMRSKLEAVAIVTRSGGRAVIANARMGDVLPRLIAGEALGTCFAPRPRRMSGRKRWIAFFEQTRGGLHVDAGAAAALMHQNRSLLSIGITAVEGDFQKGAPVRIIDPCGSEIARGLVNFPAESIRRILGKRSGEIGEILGRCEYGEVVHRDNLVLAGEE